MSTNTKKAVILSSLGAGFEYYDFIIYAMMAEYLSVLFFPQDAVTLGLIKTFAIFAIGYLFRPLGGILFGLFGDVFGRKKSFQTVMLLMALSTIAIGLLPTYSQVGVSAAYVLLALRALQGLSFGAELPGAITIVCEYSQKQSQGKNSGFVMSSISLGSALASFVLFILTAYSDRNFILDGGWRIPFIFGGSLAIVNYFIRSNLQETPEFSKLNISNKAQSIVEAAKNLLQNYRKEIMKGIALTWTAASLVIFALSLPTYLLRWFNYEAQDVYLAMTCGLLWCALMLPICGKLIDGYNKQKAFLIINLAFIPAILAIFGLFSLGSPVLLIVAMMLYQTIIAFLSVCFLPLLSETFPTQVRYTGIALCYNTTYVVMGCLPVLIATFGGFGAALWMLIVPVIGILIFFRDSRDSRDLRDTRD